MKPWILIALLLLVSCTPRITNPGQALQAIQDLDAEYNTYFREEMTNKLMLGTAEIEDYLEELAELRLLVSIQDEKERRVTEWLFEARKQMLLSQLNFQRGWFGVGTAGRVSDGFACSEFDSIREETRLLEEAWSYGLNSTRLLDSVMTESDFMREAIGVGRDKPAIYSSDFEGIYTEAKSNIAAMERFCNLHIETTIDTPPKQ